MPEHAEEYSRRYEYPVNRPLSRKRIKRCITKRTQALFWYYLIQKAAGLFFAGSSLYLTIIERDLTYFILCGFLGLYLMFTRKKILH